MTVLCVRIDFEPGGAAFQDFGREAVTCLHRDSELHQECKLNKIMTYCMDKEISRYESSRMKDVALTMTLTAEHGESQ